MNFSGENLNGRMVYVNKKATQRIYYLYGEFDGWMLGPQKGILRLVEAQLRGHAKSFFLNILDSVVGTALLNFFNP